KSLRENFVATREDYAQWQPPAYTNGNGNGNGNGTAAISKGIEQWTERDGNTWYIPRIDWRGAGLRDDVNQYEITVKLFLLPNTSVSAREQYIHESLALVMKELNIKSIDLLVVSFPGMSFEGNCEWEADKLNAQQGNIEEEVATWKVLEKLQSDCIVGQLGVSEFGSEKLRAFIQQTTIPPAVDQINLRDCCSVPPPLKQLAEEKRIELNVHTDCTDILPPGTLREMLSHGPQGAGILADADHKGDGVQGELTPQWVVRYMAFVRDRGVIENKGYFAGAELQEN
ncbi:hypothetical protein Golomagni_06134, partial [Golovinomyces magnicellulatus]